MTPLRFFARGEIRLNEDASIDEIVTGQLQGFHLEQMDDDAWWLGIYGKDGRRVSINFVRKGKRIRVMAEEDGEHPDGVSAGYDKPRKTKP